jgi:hypothetical protein
MEVKENDNDITAVADTTVDLCRSVPQSLTQPAQKIPQTPVGRMGLPHMRRIGHRPIFNYGGYGALER